MKPISVHVSEEDYREFKLLAGRRGKPVAELIRQAMADYLQAHRPSDHSILDIAPHRSGKLLSNWQRADLYEEMRKR